MGWSFYLYVGISAWLLFDVVITVQLELQHEILQGRFIYVLTVKIATNTLEVFSSSKGWQGFKNNIFNWWRLNVINARLGTSTPFAIYSRYFLAAQTCLLRCKCSQMYIHLNRFYALYTYLRRCGITSTIYLERSTSAISVCNSTIWIENPWLIRQPQRFGRCYWTYSII